MDWIDCACKPVLGHNREAIALCFVQLRIGGDDCNRGIFARPTFGTQDKVACRNLGGPFASTEFIVLFEWRCPEMRTISDHSRADSIDDRKRTNRDAIARERRGRANSTF